MERYVHEDGVGADEAAVLVFVDVGRVVGDYLFEHVICDALGWCAFSCWDEWEAVCHLWGI